MEPGSLLDLWEDWKRSLKVERSWLLVRSSDFHTAVEMKSVDFRSRFELQLSNQFLHIRRRFRQRNASCL